MKETLRFGLVSSWGAVRNAEFEFQLRLRAAALSIGADVILMSPEGVPLDWLSGVPTGDKYCGGVDFAISTHFATNKQLNIPHVYLNWNPPLFLEQFGMARSIENLRSFDFIAPFGSETLDASVVQLVGRHARLLESPFPPSSISNTGGVSPSPKDRLFYCGINWERLSNKSGRFDSLLDKVGLKSRLEIYGPAQLSGQACWEGMRDFRGELPFDGISVINRIRQLGACLCLISPAHYWYDCISMRTFEALAAGSEIICPDMPYLRALLGDSAFYFPQDGRVEEISEAILGSLSYIENGGGRMSQEVLLRYNEKFSLESCLSRLVDELGDLRPTSRRRIDRRGIGKKKYIRIVDAAFSSALADEVKARLGNLKSLIQYDFEDIIVSDIGIFSGAGVTVEQGDVVAEIPAWMVGTDNLRRVLDIIVRKEASWRGQNIKLFFENFLASWKRNDASEVTDIDGTSYANAYLGSISYLGGSPSAPFVFQKIDERLVLPMQQFVEPLLDWRVRARILSGGNIDDDIRDQIITSLPFASAHLLHSIELVRHGSESLPVGKPIPLGALLPEPAILPFGFLAFHTAHGVSHKISAIQTPKSSGNLLGFELGFHGRDDKNYLVAIVQDGVELWRGVVDREAMTLVQLTVKGGEAVYVLVLTKTPRFSFGDCPIELRYLKYSDGKVIFSGSEMELRARRSGKNLSALFRINSQNDQESIEGSAIFRQDGLVDLTIDGADNILKFKYIKDHRPKLKTWSIDVVNIIGGKWIKGLEAAGQEFWIHFVENTYVHMESATVARICRMINTLEGMPAGVVR